MKTYTLKEVLALYEDNNESGYYYGYKGIVLNAIEKGYSISVNNGEEWSTDKSTDYMEVIKDIETVDDCDLNFFDKSDKYVGWAKIILYNDYNESVSDYTANDEMESLDKHRGESAMLSKWDSFLTEKRKKRNCSILFFLVGVFSTIICYEFF